MIRLTRAQRTMLREAITSNGLKNVQHHPRFCVAQALHRKGLVQGIEHQPTEAGRAIYKNKEVPDGQR